MKFIAALLLLLSPTVFAHGVTSASAKIELRPANLIELQIQFNFIDLLNHQEKKYSLPVIASLSEQDFSRLYQAVIQLFNQHLTIKIDDKLIHFNKRYPTQQQIMTVLKTEFITSKFHNKQTPYTFSDRRFYQVFSFDFKLKSAQEIEKIRLSFPKQLGTVYTTFSQQTTRELHAGVDWKL